MALVTSIGPLPDAFDVGKPRSAIEWATAPNSTGFWLVSDYRLARQILADRRFSRSGAVGPDVPKIFSHDSAPDAIISLEGTEHARLRRLVAPAFTERRIAKLTPFIERSVADLLDGLEAQGPLADFVSQVSSPLPFGVLCHLLGIPPRDREVFGAWVNVLFRLEDSRADTRPQSVALVRYMMRVIASKRRNPSADLISGLIRSAEEDGSATDHEIVTLCLSLLMAGYDTTVDQITLCVLTVLLDPPLMKSLSDNPERAPAITDELMRVNPAPFMTFPRVATESVRIGDAVIEPGQLIAVSVIAANRDPSAFGPAAARAGEAPLPAHLTFGYGVHRCLGAPLASRQLTTLLPALARRFPGLRLAEEPSSLTWKTGMATRGLPQLHVTWLVLGEKLDDRRVDLVRSL
jgi:cytochrome P450